MLHPHIRKTREVIRGKAGANQGLAAHDGAFSASLR